MTRLFMSITKPSPLKRFIFFCIADIALITISLFISFLFHFELNSNISYYELVAEVIIYFIVVKIAALTVFRVYSMSWRYASINDLLNIVLALIFSEFFLVAMSLPNPFLPSLSITGLPKRIFFVDGIISLCLIAGIRISKRVYLEVLRKGNFANKGKRTIILGAGNTGEMIIRDMARRGYREFNPVCLLDDDKAKAGTYIHGVRVQGKSEDLENFILKEKIEAVIIAIPTLNHKKLQNIYSVAIREKVQTIKIVPRIYGFDKPDLNLKSLEDISVEDLIGRQTVEIDYTVISEFLRDKTVLITGAGGSIGSELVMQVCAFRPGRVILFDIDDTDLHTMTLRVNKHYPRLADKTFFIIGDVKDEQRVLEVFREFKPQIVFHAAAFKHVPMMEHNPKEAVKVNIFGTYILAKIALDCKVERFIMISTDKAVRPTSVMGATKRVAEYICQAMNSGNRESEIVNGEMQSTQAIGQRVESGTKFISVRFGNVLGSRGSVIPLFLEQLKNGGPLTVTHKDMVRFFMTIPEAVSLILQASTMGEGGEVFVLDMGEPVKIVELAEELITIQGLRPYKDIDIEFTGVRPGEKIFEEILTAEEGTVASKHQKVFVARNGVKYSQPQIEEILGEFSNLISESKGNDIKSVKELLRKYVRHYEGE
ncbi:MAG: UDP-N-acetylglucosamine 4,6-dehydratase / UDP-4-dehydro-6-deoxy-2-acetamido-D-glucose 4-reductase [Deltaproteobacteria bacterium]|nr:UDP-N-acetylglucosamine 4,6-dehydratase / UDP-4-dehydro-6-deoxy-2-acetamido-D-glucose 4-reductase [Deltaproteobacteria bacterium]